MNNLFKIIITTAVFAVASIAVVAQTTPLKAQLYKNELGIDVANVITFLAKRNESYLLMYKYYMSDKNALRLGVNFDYGTATGDGTYVAGRIGYQHNFPLIKDKWLMYIGADLTGFSTSSNFQKNTIRRIGVAPIVGVNYFFSKSFSLSTELSFNFMYTEYRNPDSFDADANADVFDANLGSVGMIVLSYHFDVPFRKPKK